MLAGMDEQNTDVIQGTLDMLILKTLSLEPMHGFGIARRIEQISREVFKVNPGSLLTALQRLERAGWLDAASRQVLRSHARRKEAARGGNRGLGASDVGYLATLEGGGLAGCLCGVKSHAACA